jgi:hypothetical protein
MKEYAHQITQWRDTHGQIFSTKIEALYSSYKAKRHDLGMQCMLLTYRASNDSYDRLKDSIDELANVHDAIVKERLVIGDKWEPPEDEEEQA